MNDDELAALADKLYAQGLGDDEVDEHLRRAMGTAGENETTPVEAGAMHALDALSFGLGSGRPGEFSGYQGGAGGRQMLSPEARAEREAGADDYDTALAGAEQEHPTAATVGRYGTLALPIVGIGPKGVMSAARGVAGAGARLAGVGKAMADELPVVGRRGLIGRPVRAGMKAWEGSRPVTAMPVPPTPNAARGAFEVPPQGSFPPIEGTGGGQTTFGMSVGEARAANAPAAYAREHVVAGTARPPAAGVAAERAAHRPYGAGPEGGMQEVAYPGRRPIQVPIDSRYAETILGPTGSLKAPVVAGTPRPVPAGAGAEMRGYSRTGSTTPSRPQAHRVGVAKGVPKPPPVPEARASGLDSPEAKRLSKELNDLMAQHLAQGA